MQIRPVQSTEMKQPQQPRHLIYSSLRKKNMHFPKEVRTVHRQQEWQNEQFFNNKLHNAQLHHPCQSQRPKKGIKRTHVVQHLDESDEKYNRCQLKQERRFPRNHESQKRAYSINEEPDTNRLTLKCSDK